MAERTAIVTGAGKRVGAQIARALLDDDWAVVAHVRKDGDVVPPGAVKVVADLEDPRCSDPIFGAVSDLPPLRLLVNNAARFSFDAPGEFKAGEFDRHMAVNVRAPLLLIEKFAAIHDCGDALVVNLLDAKLAFPNGDFLSYTLSKFTLAAATGIAARALAAKQIRVNGIAPALMLPSAGQTEQNYRAMHSNNPLGRGVEPDDVIRAIRYLVDATAVTGEVITIDSGQRFMGLARDVQFLEKS